MDTNEAGSTPQGKTLYRYSGVTVEEFSDFGDKHRVAYYTAVKVFPTDRALPYDNGYSTEETPLWITQDGVDYHAHPSIDYSGGTTYANVQDPRDVLWSRPSGAHARLIDGKAITPHTPDGRPLGEIDPAYSDEAELAEYHRLKRKFG